MRPVHIAAVVLAGCAAASAIRPAHSQPPQRLPEPLKPGAPAAGAADPHATVYGVGKAPFAQRPATSCSASSCHGGGAVGKVGSEHSTWAPEAFPQGQQDPHAKAYRVLFNPVSVEMAKKLGYPNAHTAAVCLKCHAVESPGDPETRDQVLSEGVGCGGCHGPAEKWVGIHYTNEWKALSNREKWEKYGFVPAGNLVARALNCAGCHVGDAERDLNHDLYAAGHPRVTFEPARLHADEDYRKHWSDEKARPRADFEVRLWLIGQVAGLRAATNLLHERATRAAEGDPKTPWPEFAGYSCYSCHQKVGEGEAAVRNAVSDSFKLRRLGVPAWETWSGSTLDLTADYCKKVYTGLSFDLTAVKQLQKTMGSKASPAAAAVAKESADAVKALDAWLAAMQAAEDDKSRPQLAPQLAAELATAIAGDVFTDPAKGGRVKDHDWDALAARYLGCAAVLHATGGTAGWKPELEAVRDGLAFPKLQKGPRLDSPAGYDQPRLNELRGLFEKLRDATKTKGGNQ